MQVIARKGLRVPIETGSRRYVTDGALVDVPNTVYYRRRIAEGDLLSGEAATKAAAAAKPAPVADTSPANAVAPDANAAPAGDKKSTKGA
ncbi:hypothetical protein LMG29542_04783 [Paraburkholderia humisilvae]|uniref:DUF2635 domain-containing protein n=2 Tax=Paraburkholderia humisilvae TaxID=627669 RepID=A0A6J5EEB4_9BURK|nr:hypothetical protein LMG29542_04783 [Paraburkholderia humisilvae]